MIQKKANRESVSYKKFLKDELQKKLERLRQHANDLCYVCHQSKRAISKRLRVSRNFVSKWTRKKKMDYTVDHRGWKKGKRRKWQQQDEQRLVNLYRSLTAQKDNFFSGATAIEQQWRKCYRDSPPPLRTLGRMMKQLGLSKNKTVQNSTGASRYLCYPERSIHHYAGRRVLEIDFIGKKFITGRTAPVHFAGCSFKYAPKLRYYERVQAETAEELTRVIKCFIERYEKPQVIKMDNGFAMNGTAPQPRVLSKLPLALLQQKIYPMYAVPRKPFTQASIEGNNSVFAKKFWRKYNFTDTQFIEKKLRLFNEASRQYYNYQPLPSREEKKFIPKIFYLRQVKENEKGKAFIEVSNDLVLLPKSYIHYFVFVKWNLQNEKLTVFIEKEKRLKKIKTISFKLNTKSKEKIKKIFF